MKKLLLTLALSASFFASAQNNLKFGFNAGATLSDVRGNEELDRYKNALDYLVGLSLELPLNDNFSVFANVNYERKSFVQKIQFESGGFDPVINPDNIDKANLRGTLQYISVPINVKYYIGAKKNFYVHAGPYAAVFIDDKFKFNGDEVRELTGSSDFKTLDFGITAGAGAQFSLDPKHNLSIGVRNNLGLANVSKMGADVRTNALNLVIIFESIL